MPKKRDAFAFRDFDGERILQRNFFIELAPSVGTDEEILSAYDCEQFYPKYLLNTTVIETQRDGLRWLYRFVDDYQNFLNRHCERIVRLKSKFAEKFISTGDVSFKRKYERTYYWLNRYRAVQDAVIMLREEIRRLGIKLSRLYEWQWQKEFGERLREARRAKGLTQANLGEKIGRSQNAIQKYESGVADISSRSLLKVAKVLGVSADSLLGLK